MGENKITADNNQSPSAVSMNTLRQSLDGLLSSKSGINESRAKQLRKDWDNFLISSPVNAENQTLVDKMESDLGKLRDRIHAQVEQRDAQYAKIEENLETLRATIKGGDLKASQALDADLITALNRIYGLSSQRRQTVINELEKLRPKMQVLTDWRHWGTTQAREKIMDEIRTIHDTEKDLEKVGKRIQQARDEWREWDKSGEGGDHKLYKAFDKICSDAYKPCAVFFDKQKRLRQDATKARAKCCETLEKAFETIEWREPDWKDIQQLIRNQQTFWRKHRQPEFKHRKALQARFEAIMAKFEDNLDRERRRNFKQRESLIEKVDELAKLDDVRSAMDSMMDLKKQWLVTVNSGRKQEQVIWKKFTGACDSVYEKRHQERKQADLDQKANLHAKQAICKDIEEFSQTHEKDNMAFASKLAQWQTQWDDIGFVPKKSIGSIDKRFKAALALAKKHNASLQAKNKSDQEQLLATCAQICEQIEAALLDCPTDAVCEFDIAQVETQWQSFNLPISESMTAIRSRYESAKAALTDLAMRQKLQNDMPSNIERMHSLLMQYEIATDTDSPGDFAQQRMAMQIARLSAAMGKNKTEELVSEAQLVNNILMVGLLPADERQMASKRFKACQGK